MKYPVVRFSLGDNAPTLLTQSKVGGFPYLPIGQELPKNTKTGNPLTLLAQINFAEMPHLPDFPTKGILQFFIDKDDEKLGQGGSEKYIPFVEYYDYSYEDLYENKFPLIGYRVIYHAEILEENQLVTDFSDYPTFNYDYEYSVVGGEYPIIFNQVIEEDYGYKNLDRLPVNKIGGIASFIQGDVFYEYFEESWNKRHLVLFQLDSQRDLNSHVKFKRKVIFGDCGIANFFITPEDLKNLDFTKVAYTWAGG